MIPEHMHHAVIDWIERAEPAPHLMGSFFHAVLTNDFIRTVANADDKNKVALLDWANFLYNYAPRDCFGSPANLERWRLGARKIEVVEAPGDLCGNTGVMSNGQPCPGCRACS